MASLFILKLMIPTLAVFAVILLLAIPSHAQSNELAAVANDADLSFGHPKHEVCVDFLRGFRRRAIAAIIRKVVAAEFGTTKPCCSCRAGDPERQILSTPTMLRQLRVVAHEFAKFSWLPPSLRGMASGIKSVRKCVVRKCFGGRAKVVDIGPSRSNSKTTSVPSGYRCPKTVSKANWVNKDNYGDTFSIAQRGTSLSVTRTDENKGWGMSLKVMCGHAGYVNKLRTKEVVVGSANAKAKVVSAPAGYICPSAVSKDNWAGQERYGDTFAITQSGTKLTVTRTDGGKHHGIINGGWGMDLKLMCSRSGMFENLLGGKLSNDLENDLEFGGGAAC